MLTYMKCDTTCRTVCSRHELLSDLTRPHAFVSNIPESSAVSSPSIDSSRGAHICRDYTTPAAFVRAHGADVASTLAAVRGASCIA